MKRLASSLVLAPVLVGLAGCDVPDPPASTGGVDTAASACGRGVVVASSDYASTSVALVGTDGVVLSESILSSASASSGISTPLSGDVVLPLARPASGLVVLLDRYPNGVLTWLDPRTARVVAQLSVATGFASNPQDYVEVDAKRAYVSRYESNPAPGKQPFDGGGDVVVVDLATHAIAKSIPLPVDGGFLPRASRLQRVRDHVLVSLQRFDAAFKSAGDARLVAIDVATDAIAWQLDVPGVAGCGGLALSPSGETLAMSCAGSFADGAGQDARAGVVVLDARGDVPVVLRRIDAAALGGPAGPSIAFASETELVGTAYGSESPKHPDVAFVLDVGSGVATRAFSAARAFVLGDVRCTTGCTARCFVADADRSGLARFAVTAGAAGPIDVVPVDVTRGLPPRYLGGFLRATRRACAC